MFLNKFCVYHQYSIVLLWPITKEGNFASIYVDSISTVPIFPIAMQVHSFVFTCVKPYCVWCLHTRGMRFSAVHVGLCMCRRRLRKDREYGASRGIDFHNVANVINFEFPTSVDAYVHRVGRFVSPAGEFRCVWCLNRQSFV